MSKGFIFIIGVAAYFLMSCLVFISIAYYDRKTKPEKRKGASEATLLALYWPGAPLIILIDFVMRAGKKTYKRIVGDK